MDSSLQVQPATEIPAAWQINKILCRAEARTDKVLSIEFLPPRHGILQSLMHGCLSGVRIRCPGLHLMHGHQLHGPRLRSPRGGRLPHVHPHRGLRSGHGPQDARLALPLRPGTPVVEPPPPPSRMCHRRYGSEIEQRRNKSSLSNGDYVIACEHTASYPVFPLPLQTSCTASDKVD